MAVRSVTKGILKSSGVREAADEAEDVETEGPRPRNPPSNTSPTEGFFLEVDRKIKSQHPTLEAATKIGAELKRKFPVLHVTVYDAAGTTRTLVEAAE
jgi:hypothetical protein